jgi:FkbM family methyltransferase
MSHTVARAIAAVARLSTAVMKPYRRRITRALVCQQMAQQVAVGHNGHTLLFQATTARSLHDVLTLGSGEPETVAWLDGLEPGMLWDVGANVGLYSLYAACARGCGVVAFEPSAASFAALAKNVELNGASDRVSLYCMALGDRTHLDSLWMACSDAGHSMHRVGEADGRAFRQSIPVFSADDLVRVFDVPRPRYLKIDVDGPELAVLRGMTEILSGVDSILVEAETEQAEQAISAALLPLGFRRNEDIEADRSRNIVFDRGAR